MTKIRLALCALLMLLATAVTVVGCSTEIAEVPAAADPTTTSQTAPVTTTAAPTTTTTEPPTTTTTAAPTTTQAPVTTVKPKPVPTTAKPQPKPTAPAPVATNGDSFLNCVMMRESRGNPSAVNPSSGAGGLFQYLRSTWHNLGYDSRFGVAGAEYASYDQQWEAARDTLARVGRSPWAGGNSPC